MTVHDCALRGKAKRSCQAATRQVPALPYALTANDTGAGRFASGGAETAHVPFTVRVWDFAFPRENRVAAPLTAAVTICRHGT